MFTEIELTNFRAIGKMGLRVPLRPLTILVGENGTGKTSVLQALALTAQSATEQLRLQDLVVQGSKWTVSDAAELYHGHDLTQPLSVRLTLDLRRASWLTSTLSSVAELGSLGSFPPETFAYRWTRVGQETTAWSHRYDLNDTTVWDWRGVLFLRDNRWWEANYEVWVKKGAGVVGPFFPVRPLDRVLPDQMFFPIGSVVRQDFPAPPSAEGSENKKDPANTASWHRNLEALLQNAADALRPLANEMREKLARVSIIDPIRGKDLIVTDTGESLSPGIHGENLLKLLTTLQVRRSRNFADFRAWAERFGLRSVEAGNHNNQLDLVAVDANNNTTVRFTEFATGSFQALLIAAHVLLAPADSVLLIEEPEANMHPAFEKLLAELFENSIRLGHQLIVTTHSEILVAAVGALVRRGVLAPGEVTIHELSRTPQGIVGKPLELTDRGLAEWVKSFTNVEASLSQEWANGLPEEG